MAEQPASTCEPVGDAAAKAVIALCDRFLAQAGVPTYGALADARIGEIERAAALLMDDAQRRKDAELLRLRIAHAVIASELRAALAALERQDLFALDNLLTETMATAAVHARPHHMPSILPANVIPLGPARIARRARDFGRL